MGDKISKALDKLRDKERLRAKETITLIEHGDITGLDIKKLKGYENLFRVRLGSLRIIYEIKNGTYRALSVTRRGSKTYSF